MAYTFIGGTKLRTGRVKLPWRNFDSAFIQPAPPKRVYISMEQHAMDRCDPAVTIGHHVSIGDVVGTSRRSSACSIYAGVSGIVVDIFPHKSMTGATVDCVVIESDEIQEYSRGLTPITDSLLSMESGEIFRAIKQAGVTDFGVRPTALHKKLMAAQGVADRFIVRCFDSDPCTSVNASIAIEDPEAVIGGIKILLHALSIHRAIVVTWSDEKDVMYNLSEVNYPKEMIMPVKVNKKYPQYDPRMLVSALLNKENLAIGKTVSGCIILDAQTVAAVYYALVNGTPHTSRYISVSGKCVAQPMNFIVPVGTPLSHITANCLPVNMKYDKIVEGNRISGRILADGDIIDTSVSSLIFQWEHKTKASACTNCGKCVRLCPGRISPKNLAFAAKKDKVSLCRKLGIDHCIKCELCSKICPSNIPLFDYIKMGKKLKKYAIKSIRSNGDHIFDPSDFIKADKEDNSNDLAELMNFAKKVSEKQDTPTEEVREFSFENIVVPEQEEENE